MGNLTVDNSLRSLLSNLSTEKIGAQGLTPKERDRLLDGTATTRDLDAASRAMKAQPGVTPTNVHETAGGQLYDRLQLAVGDFDETAKRATAVAELKRDHGVAVEALLADLNKPENDSYRKKAGFTKSDEALLRSGQSTGKTNADVLDVAAKLAMIEKMAVAKGASPAQGLRELVYQARNSLELVAQINETPAQVANRQLPDAVNALVRDLKLSLLDLVGVSSNRGWSPGKDR